VMALMANDNGDPVCYNSKYYTTIYTPYLISLNASFGQVGHVTSVDGVDWTCSTAECGSVLRPSTDSEVGDSSFATIHRFGHPWKKFIGAIDVNVSKLGADSYWAIYDSSSQMSQLASQVYIARSPDGLNWLEEKVETDFFNREEIIEHGAYYTWEGGGLHSPSLVMHNDLFKIWYQGAMYYNPAIPALSMPKFNDYDTSAIGLVEFTLSELKGYFDYNNENQDYQDEVTYLTAPCTGVEGALCTR
jgi:hypothetical protein